MRKNSLWIFLGATAMLVVANPFFWSIMRMNFAAEPVVYIEQDGTTTGAVLGPKAPWPDWVTAPPGGRLTVQSYFAGADALATGVGAFAFSDAPLDRLDGFLAALDADGWRVETAQLETVEPSLPPRPMTLCSIVASRDAPDARYILYSFEIDARARTMDVFWSSGGDVQQMIGAMPGPCSG